MNELALDTKKTSRFAALLFVLALTGAAFGVYALIHHIELKSGTMQGPSLCAINQTINCDKVNSSRYSELFGIPIASFGLMYYGWICVVALSVLAGASTLARSVARDLILPWSLAALTISLLLAYLSATELEAVCLVCSAMHLVNLLIALVVYLYGPRAHSLIRRIGLGLVELPRGLGIVGKEVEGARVNRFAATLLTGALCAFIYFAPELYRDFGRIAKARSMTPHTPSQVERAVQEWRIAPEKAIEVVTDGIYADGVLGDERAPVTIVEFSDLECPWCRKTGPMIEEIVKHFSPKIRLVFKHFPLDKSCNAGLDGGAHQHACRMAAAAQCAREQGKFWEVLGLLYTMETTNRTKESVDGELRGLASAYSLDSEAFESCLKSDRVIEKLSRDIALGNQIGVEGTPTIYVNGRRVPVPDERVLRAVILEALATK